MERGGEGIVQVHIRREASVWDDHAQFSVSPQFKESGIGDSTVIQLMAV